MRISDWGSDVCSSDLAVQVVEKVRRRLREVARRAEVQRCRRASRHLRPEGEQRLIGGHRRCVQTHRVPRRIVAEQHARTLEAASAALRRSEEHTSELQSLMRISSSVLCLKKKNKTNNDTSTHKP